MAHVIKNVLCYFYPEDKDVQLSKNFKVGEFHSRNNNTIFIEQEIIETLQKIRNEIGQPIDINSGFRSQAHNTAVGGSYNSAHLWGCAADFHARNMSAPELAKIVSKMFGRNIAIGLHTPENYIHIDTLYRGNWYAESLSNKVNSF